MVGVKKKASGSKHRGLSRWLVIIVVVLLFLMSPLLLESIFEESGRDVVFVELFRVTLGAFIPPMGLCVPRGIICFIQLPFCT